MLKGDILGTSWGPTFASWEKRMDTLFLNAINSGTFDPHRLLLNLKDKKNLKRIDKCVALSNLRHVLYVGKYQKVMQK